MSWYLASIILPALAQIPPLIVREPVPASPMAQGFEQVRPFGNPARDPETRTVETAYRCDGEDVRFTARFDGTRNVSMTRGHRAFHAWSPEELSDINTALGRLTAVTAIEPRCAAEIHIIAAFGTHTGEPSCVLIVWNVRSVQVTPPFVANEPRSLCSRP